MRSSQLLIHSLFLGLCAAVLTCLISFSPASIFTFFSTSFAYLFLRKNLLTTPPFSFYFWLVVLGTLSAGAFSALSDHQKETAIYAGIVTMAYALPGRFGLRRVLLLKPLIIGLSWALMTIGIAADKSIFSIPNDHSVFSEFIIITSSTIALSLLYDYRDDKLLNSSEVSIPSVSQGYLLFMLFLIYLPCLIYLLSIRDFIHLFPVLAMQCWTVVVYKVIPKTNYLQSTWLVDFGFIVYAVTSSFLR